MRVAIFGATGYSGTEAMRLLAARSDIEIVWVGSNSKAGQLVKDVLPQLRHLAISELRFEQNVDLAFFKEYVEVAMLALPHGQAQMLVPQLLKQGIRVIDFSGDFRLSPELYETWYKRPYKGADDIKAVYGLPELFRDRIRDAMLIANPGCYATAAELALLPLMDTALIDDQHLVLDAKSGVTGAGKNPQQSTHFVEVEESLRAYKVGEHQHTPEIEQVLWQAKQKSGNYAQSQGTLAPTILMTTQLLPIRRGIYMTAYAFLQEKVSAQEIHEIYTKRYALEPFVDVLPLGQIPEIRYVTGTNVCQLGIHVDTRTNTVLVMSSLDNLVKGAAGQAIQNLNLMFGCDETLGLPVEPWV